MYNRFRAVKHADVAQSVERILGKDEVTGSNPVISSRNQSEMAGFFVVLGWVSQKRTHHPAFLLTSWTKPAVCVNPLSVRAREKRLKALCRRQLQAFLIRFQATGRAVFARSHLPFAQCFNVVSAERGLKRAFARAASAARNVASLAGRINSANCALGVLRSAESPVRLPYRFPQLVLYAVQGSVDVPPGPQCGDFRCPREF